MIFYLRFLKNWYVKYFEVINDLNLQKRSLHNHCNFILIVYLMERDCVQVEGMMERIHAKYVFLLTVLEINLIL